MSAWLKPSLLVAKPERLLVVSGVSSWPQRSCREFTQHCASWLYSLCICRESRV